MTPSLGLVVKLASFAVHMEEAWAPGGHPYDVEAAKSMLVDPEVRAFLDDPKNAAFLPRKRSKDGK